MRTSTLIIFFFGFFFSCDHDDFLNGVTKQQWFKDLQVPCEKDDICKTGIMQGMYKGNTVVYFTYLGGGYCDPSFFVILYDEQGEVVKEYDESNALDFNTEVTSLETIWTCSCGYIINGKCFSLIRKPSPIPWH